MIVHGIGGRHVAMQTVGAPTALGAAGGDDGSARPRVGRALRHAGGAPRALGRAASDHRAKWLDRFKTVEEAVKTLTAARVPASPVLSPAEVVAHPHLAERQAFPGSSIPGAAPCASRLCPFTSTAGR